jgi:drug/metabolite transporter (DMT)-like permease
VQPNQKHEHEHEHELELAHKPAREGPTLKSAPAAATPGAPIIPAWAYFSLASGMALVGCYVGLSKLLVAVFPVLLLAWLRFAIAAVAMLPWLRRALGEVPLSKANRWLLFWESFLGNFLFSICMLYGVAMTSALAAGVTMAAIPAMVAVLSRIFLHEQIRQRVVAGIACAALGIALLALARQDGSANANVSPAAAPSVWGYVLLMCAVFCEACYVVIGKKLSAAVSPKRISALINLWGLALVTPLGLWQAWSFDFAQVAAGTWGLLLFYSIAASIVSVWLWMQGLRHVPSSRAGVFAVVLPVSAALVGVLVLHEPFGAAHGAAFVLALIGLLLATWPESQSSR